MTLTGFGNLLPVTLLIVREINAAFAAGSGMAVAIVNGALAMARTKFRFLLTSLVAQEVLPME